MRERFAALALALALDFALGDPAWLPHPVVFIGRYIAKAEVRLRRRGGNLRRAAVLLTLSLTACAAAPAAAICEEGDWPPLNRFFLDELARG